MYGMFIHLLFEKDEYKEKVVFFFLSLGIGAFDVFLFYCVYIVYQTYLCVRVELEREQRMARIESTNEDMSVYP
jgi:hypothetical protein